MQEIFVETFVGAFLITYTVVLIALVWWALSGWSGPPGKRNTSPPSPSLLRPVSFSDWHLNVGRSRRGVDLRDASGGSESLEKISRL